VKNHRNYLLAKALTLIYPFDHRLKPVAIQFYSYDENCFELPSALVLVAQLMNIDLLI